MFYADVKPIPPAAGSSPRGTDRIFSDISTGNRELGIWFYDQSLLGPLTQRPDRSGILMIIESKRSALASISRPNWDHSQTSKLKRPQHMANSRSRKHDSCRFSSLTTHHQSSIRCQFGVGLRTTCFLRLLAKILPKAK